MASGNDSGMIIVVIMMICMSACCCCCLGPLGYAYFKDETFGGALPNGLLSPLGIPPWYLTAASDVADDEETKKETDSSKSPKSNTKTSSSVPAKTPVYIVSKNGDATNYAVVDRNASCENVDALNFNGNTSGPTVEMRCSTPWDFGDGKGSERNKWVFEPQSGKFQGAYMIRLNKTCGSGKHVLYWTALKRVPWTICLKKRAPQKEPHGRQLWTVKKTDNGVSIQVWQKDLKNRSVGLVDSKGLGSAGSGVVMNTSRSRPSVCSG